MRSNMTYFKSQAKSCTPAYVVFELNQCDRWVSVFSILYAAGGSLVCDGLHLKVRLHFILIVHFRHSTNYK